MRMFGVLLFALLFIGLLGLVVSIIFSYGQHAADHGDMQSAAAGFGLLGMLEPAMILLTIPACFIVIFLAVRSRRR